MTKTKFKSNWSLIGIQTLSVLLTAVSLSTASAIDFSKFLKCDWFLSVNKPKDEVILKGTPIESATMQFWVMSHIENQQASYANDVTFKPTESLSFLNQSFEVLGLLGIGAEANVYLIKNDSGFFVLKELRIGNHPTLSNMEVYQSKLDVAASGVFRVPKILAINPGKKSTLVLMEYLEGVPLHLLKKDYKKLGLTEEEVSLVEDEFEQRNSLLSNKMAKINVLYNLKTKEFFLIDHQ